VRRREHQRRLVERQRPVDIAEHLSRALVRGADHDPVREFEIADRGALAQKFRIGGNDEIGRRADLADRSTSSPVPTGTVDLVTTTVKPESARAISRAAAWT